jgi:hypothetical protein
VCAEQTGGGTREYFTGTEREPELTASHSASGDYRLPGSRVRHDIVRHEGFNRAQLCDLTNQLSY